MSENFNLIALAQHFQEQGRYADLCKDITQAYTVASAATDLTRVQKLLHLITKLQCVGGVPEEFTKEEAGTLIYGQFVSAVILYSRATVTTPINRQRWWGESSLTSELKETHQLIIHLRDKEFAHFGMGRDIGSGPLLSELLYLSPSGASPVSFRSSQWSTRPELIPDFLELADHVYETAHERMKDRFRETYDRIARIVTFDTSFFDTARKFLISDLQLAKPTEDSLIEGSVIRSDWTNVNSRPLGSLRKKPPE